MARGILFSILTVVAAAACVGDDPDTGSGTTPAPDAGGTTGPFNGGGVEDGSFENGCSLVTSNGEITPDSTPQLAHTGGKTCKLCRTPGGEPSLYLYARFNLEAKVDEVYEVSAWMRKVPGVESGGDTQITINGVGSDQSLVGKGAEANGPDAITDVWKEAKVTWTVTEAVARARIDLGVPQATDNICFLVDDLSVKKK